MFSPPLKSSESWQEALKFMGRCPVCGAEYKSEQARLFANRGSANLIHINCQNCSSSLIAMVLILGHGLSSVGMITDLSFEDAKRLHGREPITLDEVISGYKLIQDDKF